MSRRILSLAIMAAVALPLVVGCQFLVFKICVKNHTEYFLDEFAVKSAGASTYPPGVINDLAPGANGSAGGYKKGSYDIRAKFDVAAGGVCSDTLELLDVEIANTNLCITYEVRDLTDKACSGEIYATLDYVL